MNNIELKDLETGKEYIVAFRKGERWIPCIVKVVKEYTVRFIRPKTQTHSPLEFDKEYSIKDFWHEYRGVDLFGQKFRTLWVFDSFKVAQAWCEFEKAICDYIDEENLY